MSHSQFFDNAKVSRGSISAANKDEFFAGKNIDPNTNKNTITTSKKKEFSEKLWFCGKSVGEIKGVMAFYNLPILY